MHLRHLICVLTTIAAVATPIAAQDDAAKKRDEELRRLIERSQADQKAVLEMYREVLRMQEEAKRLRERVQQDDVQQELRKAMRLPMAAGNAHWGGLQLKAIDLELQEKLGLPKDEGLIVAAIEPESTAAKAGFRANDVIVRLGDKAAPNDPQALAEMVKERKAGEAFEVTIVRDGKEQAIKADAMPTAVQAPLAARGLPGFRGANGLGGRGFAPNPRFGGGMPNYQMESNVNGEKIRRILKGDEFTGSYEKDDLKITISGTVENNQPKIGEIVITEGKESKKYSDITDVPQEHRPLVRMLLPPARVGAGLQLNLRQIPVVPNFDR